MSVDCVVCNVIVIGMNFMSVLESPSWHLDSSNNRNCLVITTSVDYCGTTCTHTHTSKHSWFISFTQPPHDLTDQEI